MPIFFLLFSDANKITFLVTSRQFNSVLPFEEAVKQPILKPLSYLEYIIFLILLIFSFVIFLKVKYFLIFFIPQAFSYLICFIILAEV